MGRSTGRAWAAVAYHRPMADELARVLQHTGKSTSTITVTLSNELIHLLSEQMYQSPLKAIEELVVNSYDAGATTCRIALPLPPSDGGYALVFDDGIGMTPAGLRDLWQIGRSNKRLEEIEKRTKRRQIGKFGIGKLATYAIAQTVSYVSKTAEGLHGVTMDFTRFAADPTGGKPIELDMRELTPDVLVQEPLASAFAAIDIDPASLAAQPQWTLVILEELKTKLGRIRRRDLNWVLSTAMPLKADFKLFLNGDEIESHKSKFEALVTFSLADMPKTRLDAHEAKYSSNLRVEGDALVSNTFPQGVRGQITVTAQTLYGGKSGDLARSHGFFVRVRDRLVEEADPLFGMDPYSYSVFNRFRADIECDDLDGAVTASRDGVESSDDVAELRALLSEVFNEARVRFNAIQEKREKDERNKKEAERDFVDNSLVEQPLADSLWGDTYADEYEDEEPEADEWTYIRFSDDFDRKALIENLYAGGTRRYTFAEIDGGRASRAVSFEPESSTFWVNVDHPLVQAHDDGAAVPLLRDLLTAEVLLEVYLREVGTPSSVIGELLERRDKLLRSLADDHITSVTAIAAKLRESADDERELEMTLVLAARALGFVARHIGGSGRADGVARYSEYPEGERKITLEAKSSADVPSLNALDFSGIVEHRVDEPGAIATLCVAPAYPGDIKDPEYSQAARRARREQVSCWTVEDLARVVEASQARHITAADILGIVTTAFSPIEVREAVDALLADPGYNQHSLHGAVVDALRSLEGRMADRPRSIDTIAGEITGRPEFATVTFAEVKVAVRNVVSASHGLLRFVNKNQVVLRGDYDELERRVSSITGRQPEPRRPSSFSD